MGAGSVVDFSHPLLASAIYDAAVTGRTSPCAPRPCRHARRSGGAGPSPVEDDHGPGRNVARELEQAADISRRRGAQQLAGELFEGAALATPAEADTAAGLGRWLRAVDMYIAAGDGVAAQAALDKGSALAVLPEQQAQVLVRRRRLVDHYSGVRSLAEQAVRLAPAGEVRAEILEILGLLHRMQGHGEDALRLTRMAVTEAAAVERLDIQLAALNNRLAVEWHWAQGEAPADACARSSGWSRARRWSGPPRSGVDQGVPCGVERRDCRETRP